MKTFHLPQSTNGSHPFFTFQKNFTNMKQTIYTFLIWAICLCFSIQSFGQKRCVTQVVNGSINKICLEIEGSNISSSCPPDENKNQMKMNNGIGSEVTSSQFNELNDEPHNWFSVNKKQLYSVKIEFTLPSTEYDNLYDKVHVEFGSGVTVWLDITKHSFTLLGHHTAVSNFTLPAEDVLYDAFKNSELVKITYYNSNQSDIYKQAATRLVVVGDVMETSSLWTTTTPQLPQFILRDPPGDGSYSYIEEETQICRGHGMSLAVDASNNVYGSVKLGAKGSVGLIVQTDYEAYAEFSASLEMGVNVTSASEYEMCLTTTDRFSTDEGNADLTGSKGDVYIGSVTTYQYGILHKVRFDDCDSVTHTKTLVFAPLDTESTFMYTEEHILNTLIPDLVADTSSSDAEVKQEAKDQLEVWQKFVNINEEIKASADFAETKSFSGGTPHEYNMTSSISQVKTIDMNLYIEASVGVEVGVEVGGSGASGGFQVRTRTEMGSTTSSTNASTNTLGYSLADNDVGDQFNVGIYSDGVFGTPVFKLEEGSQSSCPYEGGYQLDMPDLTFADGTQSFTLNNIPIGEAGTFEMSICNLSDEDRTYHLKVDAATNTAGASIEGFGENISATDDGVSLNVQAQNCLNGVIITIKQTNTSILNYNGIELFLYPLCDGDEPEIESRVTLNAHFADVPNNDAACAAIFLPVDGTVQSGFTNVNATVDSEEALLVPVANDCTTSWCENNGNEVNNSVWFTFMAPASGHVEISTCDLADFNTQLALFEASDCGDFSAYNLIAANDDGPAASCFTNFDSWMEVDGLTDGQTYYVMVDGHNGSAGEFGISITEVMANADEFALQDLAQMIIFPNPSNGNFKVEFGNLKEQATLTITGLRGKVVHAQSVASNQTSIALELTNLPSGMYLMTLGTESYRLTEKLIIN